LLPSRCGSPPHELSTVLRRRAVDCAGRSYSTGSVEELCGPPETAQAGAFYGASHSLRRGAVKPDRPSLFYGARRKFGWGVEELCEAPETTQPAINYGASHCLRRRAADCAAHPYSMERVEELGGPPETAQAAVYYGASHSLRRGAVKSFRPFLFCSARRRFGQTLESCARRWEIGQAGWIWNGPSGSPRQHAQISARSLRARKP
jgi:hypothetical protein